jgi:short-subunit dehydrogenase
MELQNKGALITGASRGLGKHIARALAGKGVRLVLAARSAKELEEVAAEVRAAGGSAAVVPADVSKLSDLEKLTAAAEKELGGIDILVNNAGIETVGMFHELPLDEMRRILEVNLISAMTLTRLVLPAMVERKRGHIVNIASLAGKAGPPLSETYAASKAGMIGFTQSLRVSYFGMGVSASAVCPGFIDAEGMFADRAKASGIAAPKLIGSSQPEGVGRAVVKVIEKDLPEILVTPGPARMLAAVSQIWPRLPGWIIRRVKLRDMYQSAAGRSSPHG